MLVQFFGELAADKLRFVRPSKILFFCGGIVAKDQLGPQPAKCLRDYIVRVKRLKEEQHIVLAEGANQLYRETTYPDLITFEEDIARIAAIVLVIAESPGALAELGAFIASETIRPHLRVILQEKYEADESFIRFGPIERLKKVKDTYLGVFPWNLTANGRVVVSSVTPHYGEIKKFIADHVDHVPASISFSDDEDVKLFCVTYWVIYLALVVTPSHLYDTVQSIIPSARPEDIRNKVYCLMLVGWVEKRRYGGSDYHFCLLDEDPFLYAFKPGVTAVKDTIRRKAAISKSLLELVDAPDFVRKFAVSKRKQRQ